MQATTRVAGTANVVARPNLVAEAAQRIEERRKLRGEIARLKQKYGIYLHRPVPPSSAGSTIVEALYFWYWQKFLDRRKEIRNARNDVYALRSERFITPLQEQFLNSEIEKTEDRLWQIGIDVLTGRKYTNVAGEQVVVKDVEDWVNAMFALDLLLDRLNQTIAFRIKLIPTSVALRDQLCAEEYAKDKVCEQSACEQYKPFFRGKGFVCRSRKEPAVP